MNDDTDYGDFHEVFLKLVQAKATADYHHNKIYNGYEQGSEEHDAYAYQINQLNKLNEV